MDYMTYMALRGGNRDGGDGGRYNAYNGGQRYNGGYEREPWLREDRYMPMGPYEPHMPPYGGGYEEMEDNVVPMDAYRQIGFEARRNQPRREDGRFKRRGMEMEGGQGAYSHYGGPEEGQSVRFGGTVRMEEPGQGGRGKLTRGMAEQWVESMESDSDKHPQGGAYSWEQARELAQKVGVPTGGQRMIDFYAIINAVYSDYCTVLEQYKLDTPEIYAKLAKAWLDDPDAVKNKAAMYYRHIVDKG